MTWQEMKAEASLTFNVDSMLITSGPHTSSLWDDRNLQSLITTREGHGSHPSVPSWRTSYTGKQRLPLRCFLHFVEGLNYRKQNSPTSTFEPAKKKRGRRGGATEKNAFHALGSSSRDLFQSACRRHQQLCEDSSHAHTTASIAGATSAQILDTSIA
jgi:hypothetical protein